MMSFIQQFYQDCLVKFALMGRCPVGVGMDSHLIEIV